MKELIMSESDTQLGGYYFIMFYYIFLFYYIKASGIYYPSIAARKRHRQDGCGLEVLGDKVINEEEENYEVLVADGDDDHASIINIYKLLTNSESIEIQTDRDD